MPKHWRKCDLCDVNTYTRPELTIFLSQLEHVKAFFCELHYKPEDIRIHGNSKRSALHWLHLVVDKFHLFRLVPGAMPIITREVEDVRSDDDDDDSIIDIFF